MKLEWTPQDASKVLRRWLIYLISTFPGRIVQAVDLAMILLPDTR